MVLLEPRPSISAHSDAKSLELAEQRSLSRLNDKLFTLQTTLILHKKQEKVHKAKIQDMENIVAEQLCRLHDATLLRLREELFLAQQAVLTDDRASRRGLKEVVDQAQQRLLEHKARTVTYRSKKRTPQNSTASTPRSEAGEPEGSPGELRELQHEVHRLKQQLAHAKLQEAEVYAQLEQAQRTIELAGRRSEAEPEPSHDEELQEALHRASAAERECALLRIELELKTEAEQQSVAAWQQAEQECEQLRERCKQLQRASVMQRLGPPVGSPPAAPSTAPGAITVSTGPQHRKSQLAHALASPSSAGRAAPEASMRASEPIMPARRGGLETVEEAQESVVQAPGTELTEVERARAVRQQARHLRHSMSY
eukprot:TRINITY_DN45693_c0_g1_i1.p1 TRINITY_DN45693_c0_g1~~TRINITY_DN45693_c0_g1_i1.p1  ORF type:complete len:369 (+),score=114.90 TRINITY_DN45693_c0_g1_i1:132-1238(+)